MVALFNDNKTNDDDDGKENGKKKNVYINKQQLHTCITLRFGVPYITKHERKTHHKTACYAARRREWSLSTVTTFRRTNCEFLKKKTLKMVGLRLAHIA